MQFRTVAAVQPDGARSESEYSDTLLGLPCSAAAPWAISTINTPFREDYAQWRVLCILDLRLLPQLPSVF